MKYKLSCIFIAMLFIISSCGATNGKDVMINGKKVHLQKDDLPLYQEYEDNFKANFEEVKDVPTVVKEGADKYFSGRPYIVLVGMDINKDGKKEYFAVEPYSGVHRGILSGIIIGEDGKIQLYLDREKGIYGPGYMLLDFEKMGLKPGEVGCLRLGFSSDSINEMTFYIQSMDNELNVINHHNDLLRSSIYKDRIVVYRNVKTQEKTYGLFDLGFLSEEKMYQLNQKIVSDFRANKAKGIVFKYPEYEQDRKK